MKAKKRDAEAEQLAEAQRVAKALLDSFKSITDAHNRSLDPAILTLQRYKVMWPRMNTDWHGSEKPGPIASATMHDTRSRLFGLTA